MKRANLLVLAIVMSACGASTTPWADFQSRVLDVQERYRDTDISDATMLAYLQEQGRWADGVKADACYDPALRAFRAFLDDTTAAYTAIGGRPLSDVPIADLETARDELTQAITSDGALTAAMASARDICNR